MRTLAAAVLVLLLAAFVGLGFWQLERAAEKQVLFRAFDSADSPGIVSDALPTGMLPELRYRRLVLRGRFESSKQILLDAMTHAGQAGFHVLTPLRLSESEQWIVVNRGWVGAPADRRTLPDLSVAEGERTIRGRIDTLPSPGLRLGSTPASTSPTQPQTLLFPTMDELEEALDLELAAYQLLLDATERDGFLRAWQPRSLPPERHKGYAVQWFGLAVATVGAICVLGLRALRRRRASK